MQPLPIRMSTSQGHHPKHPRPAGISRGPGRHSVAAQAFSQELGELVAMVDLGANQKLWPIDVPKWPPCYMERHGTKDENLRFALALEF